MSINLICSDGRVGAFPFPFPIAQTGSTGYTGSTGSYDDNMKYIIFITRYFFLSMVKMSNSKLYATLGLADGYTNTYGLCACERFAFCRFCIY